MKSDVFRGTKCSPTGLKTSNPAKSVRPHLRTTPLRESPSTITIMNCTSRWTSGIPHLDVEFIVVMVRFPLRKRPSSTSRWTSGCSSRCPSGCAIHCGYRAWTFPNPLPSADLSWTHCSHHNWLIPWIPLLPWFPGNFMDSVEFGQIREKSGNFGKIQWNWVGFCMALRMNSVGIPGGFRGNAGFPGKFGVWGGFGRFGGSKGFCANCQPQHLSRSRVGPWFLGAVPPHLPEGPLRL